MPTTVLGPTVACTTHHHRSTTMHAHRPSAPATTSKPSRLVALLLCCAGIATTTEAAAETFQTIAGEAVIEAETFTRKAGSLGDWFINDALPGHSGTGYVQAAPEATGLQFDPQKRRLEYDIVFNQVGTYHVHLRSYAASHSENGFFVTLDGAAADYADGYYLHVPFADQWAWKARTGGQPGGYNPDPDSWSTVQLVVSSPGMHTFALYMREGNVRCDLIWLTKHQSTVLPQNAEPDLSDPESFLTEDCTDDVDDDGDGEIDCADPDCFGRVGSEGQTCEDLETSCLDGADNDRDGLVDCDDPDCDGEADCGSGAGGGPSTGGGSATGGGGDGAGSTGGAGGADYEDPDPVGGAPTAEGCSVSTPASSDRRALVWVAGVMLFVVGRRRSGRLAATETRNT